MSKIEWDKLLNPEQLKGVKTTEGPVLILAGAGSGKTRVLTHRVAYLMKEKGVAPYNIMAITFTNKAAREMRERVLSIGGEGADAVWVMTFHSTCVRILRRFADRIGYDTDFTIYDADDSKALMKQIIKRMNLDPKKFKEKYFLNQISSAKDELISAEEYETRFGQDPSDALVARVYRAYQTDLRENNAFDFDDLIMKTVELLRQEPEVLNHYQQRFKYIMVDEYQDTNTAQFELVRLLASSHHNICVVGDDDQSIYKFRGANIYNILNFEEHFEDAVVIRLEQNYRSTKCILSAANSVIKNNEGRKEKTLWTQNEEGDKIRFRQFDNAFEEAEFIALDVKSKNRRGDAGFSESAVLYRTNAQSRILEEKFLNENIPYKIVGGVNFYQRKEIKDVLAYLKTVSSGKDDLAVRRILNVPKRGIGATSIDKIAAYGEANGLSFYEVLEKAGEIQTLGRTASKIAPFIELIEGLRADSEDLTVPELIREILERTGYNDELEAEGTDEAMARIENIDELITKAVTYADEHDEDEATLTGFLEEVALVADIDSVDENPDYVVLMTLHAAKGLEFKNVYMAGMEDGLFPSMMTVFGDDPDELKEERRLCYVGITRAKEYLTMTAARTRMIRGETQYSVKSRFIDEIDPGLMDGDRSFSHTERGSSHPERIEGSFDLQNAENTFKKKKASITAPTVYETQAKKLMSASKEKTPLDYGVGDRVSHVKFGEGTVLSIDDGGRDYEVAVDFDGKVKRMFAGFAKLKKL